MNKINTMSILKSSNSNEINEFCITSLLNAASRSIPSNSINNNQTANGRLPKYILELIKKRRKIKRKILNGSADIKLKK